MPPIIPQADWIKMTKAILFDKPFAEAGVPNTGVYHNAWETLNAQIKEIQDAGLIVDLPNEG